MGTRTVRIEPDGLAIGRNRVREVPNVAGVSDGDPEVEVRVPGVVVIGVVVIGAAVIGAALRDSVTGGSDKAG